MPYKKELALEIVAITHNKNEAQEAKEVWENTFSKGNVPEDVLTVTASSDEKLVDIFLKHGVVSSKTEFNRLEKAGAIEEKENGVYRVGKHRFLKVVRG